VTDTAVARIGAVATFDDAAGYGSLREDGGATWWFHCTAIADGSRTVVVDAAVRFRLRPGPLGRYEAVDVRPA
jgi:cold shock CspA family protein